MDVFSKVTKKGARKNGNHLSDLWILYCNAQCSTTKLHRNRLQAKPQTTDRFKLYVTNMCPVHCFNPFCFNSPHFLSGNSYDVGSENLSIESTT